MKSFLKHIVLLLLASLVLIVLLDLAFTTAFSVGAPRNKVMWMYAMEDKRVDYVVLGSSRANYTLQPQLIEAETGKTGINLGVNATNIVETQLMLQEFLKHNTTKAVYVQVDFHYNKTTPDPVGEVDWMPFIHKPSVYDHFRSFGTKYTAYRYVPFYRYQKYGGRLGAREAVGAALGSGYDYEETHGFVALEGTITEEAPYYPIIPENKENAWYGNLVAFCEERNIELHFFTAPYYNVEGELPDLNAFLPNYTNFSDSLPLKKYFSDPMHVNEIGAEKFTHLFIHRYMNKGNENENL